MSFITIRIKGDTEQCAHCSRGVEIFSRDAAEAKFLIIQLEKRPVLGGGRCPLCTTVCCIACATRTVYGAGNRRLHCPKCGEFLQGLRREAGSPQDFGAFIEDPDFGAASPAPQA